MTPRAIVVAFVLAVLAPAALVWVPQPLSAQPAADAQGPNYQAWDQLASRTEEALRDEDTSSLSLEQLRARIAEARARFLEAQSVNQARIDTVRGQIDALGPPPEGEEAEATEIAQRRTELEQQLAELRAPVVAAEEAFRRADGLISEIDAELRRRQADALMQLWPSPVNPVNWPEGAAALGHAVSGIGNEVRDAWTSATRRQDLNDGLPLIGAYLLFALVVLLRGHSWIERMTLRLQEGTVSLRGRQAWAFLVSTGQVILPALGVLALVQAIRTTGMVGLGGDALVSALPSAGFAFFAAYWLGRRVFPRSERAFSPLQLPPERRREGRWGATALGLILSLDILRDGLLVPGALSDAARAVIIFPLIVVGGLLLLRIGQLIRLHAPSGDTETPHFDRLASIGGRVVILLGAGAPILAAVGYVAAAQAVIIPAIMSLGLIGLLLVIQNLLHDLYGLFTRSPDEEGGGQDLVPVLAGFALTLMAIPLLALIWGMRTSELLEVWTRFREGFALGDTRVSPTDFLTFVLVFLAGYLLTRLLQGTLRTSVLPKTKIEKGGQNALVSGIGYIGIFLAAVIAITSAGIDLSSLAIVAGALSVGIGFGLQNIVSNFVSGIILLIERPVSEGDWIEVGPTMGIVRAISVRSTVIETFDRTDVIVPNADLISGAVTNWTRLNLTGRLIVKVGVAYGTDTRKVERILHEVAEEQPLAVLNPPPNVLFRGFGGDALEFEIRVILRDINFVMNVHSDINHEIARRFAEEGVEIPFAQRDIWFRNPEALSGGRADGTPPAAGSTTSRTGAAPAQRPTDEDMDTLATGDAVPDGTEPDR